MMESVTESKLDTLEEIGDAAAPENRMAEVRRKTSSLGRLFRKKNPSLESMSSASDQKKGVLQRLASFFRRKEPEKQKPDDVPEEEIELPPPEPSTECITLAADA
jgi:hypothetical protein